jgi:predicted nucleic acid-binding protein
MSYLIDTNVISELRRKQPDVNVVAWFAARATQTLFVSVLTLGEIRKGIETLKSDSVDAARRQALSDWLEVDLPMFFMGRILSVDLPVTERWGHLQAQARRPLPAIDSLLAATAIQHNLTLVTRNVRDFSGLGLNVINPWDSLQD